MSGDYGGGLIVWSLKSFKEMKRVKFKKAVRNLRFEPDGQNLAVSVQGDKIYILDEEFEILKTCDHALGYS